MGTTTMTPTYVEVTADNPYVPSFIVGDPTSAWIDGSDDTEARVYYSSRISTTGDARDEAIGHLTPLSASEVTAITVRMRYRTFITGEINPGARRVNVDFFDGETFLVGLPSTLYPDASTVEVYDEEFHDLVYTLTDDDYLHAATDFAGVVAGLAREPIVYISRLDSLAGDSGFADYGISIYEFGLEITTTGSTFTPAPPARLSGRMDGAFFGAGRIDTAGPSSRSGFHPGGYY